MCIRDRHRSPAGVVALGAAAPLVHPATGFSVARSLRVATRLADAAVTRLGGATGRPVGRGEPEGPADTSWARRAVRDGQGELVHAMRRRGLDVLLRIPPGEVPEFFDRFFSLPARSRRAYLGAANDAAESLLAMLWVFARLSPRLRGHLIAGSLCGPGRAQRA